VKLEPPNTGWNVAVILSDDLCPYRQKATEETDGITGCNAPVDDTPFMCNRDDCPMRWIK
jgi:hypothetical protein